MNKNGWNYKKIDEIKANSPNALAMGPFGSNITKDNFVDSGIPVIRGVNLSKGRFNPDDFVFLTPEKADQLRASNAFPGDLVFTHRGTLGQVGIIPERIYPRYVVSQSQMKLSCDKTIVDPLFLYYYFCSIGNEELLKHKSGAGVPAIASPLTALRNLQVLLPPLFLQQKIASILSTYDDLIENNTRRIRILEEMAQAIYREWFVNFRFPGHEGVRMVESSLGRIPEGWKTACFSSLVDIDPSTKVNKEAEKPYIDMGGLSSNSMVIQWTECRTGSSGSKFHNGDVLFPRITPCLENGKCGLVDGLPGDGIGIGSTEFIVFRKKYLPPEYFYFLSRDEKFRDNAVKSMVGASGRQRVRKECFDQFYIPKPPEKVLQNFIEIISPSFKLIHILNNKNINLRLQRDLLLPRLVSGELDIEKHNNREDLLVA